MSHTARVDRLVARLRREIASHRKGIRAHYGDATDPEREGGVFSLKDVETLLDELARRGKTISRLALMARRPR